MTVTLFPSFNRSTLTEDDKANPHKSAYETYTGIVFDTKKNEFNIVTGKFRDKKDMYEKMTKQDKYLRRAYESRIWDWIQKNAETPVDGYLMLSTAVSKWINNNVLSKYYKKLLHDLPYINREGRKGDPQTMGIEANFESVENNKEMILTEDFDYDLVQQNLRRAEQAGDTSKHVIKVYPVIDGQPQYNKLLRVYGGKDSKYPEEGYLYNHLLNAQAPEKANSEKKRKIELNRIFNPLIYHDIRNETMYDDGIYTPYENLAFVIDGSYSQPIIASKLALNSIAGHLEKNPSQVPGKSINTSIDAFKIANEMNIQASNEVKRLQLALEDDTLTYEERSNLERQLQAAEAKMAKTKAVVSRVGKQTSAAFNFNDETRKQLDDISMQKAAVNSNSSLSDEEKANKLAELDKRAENIKADARENLYDVNNLYAKLDDIQANDNLSKEEKDKQIEDILNRIKYVQGMYYSNRNINNQERLIQQGYRLNKGEKPGNPKFGGDFEGEFISKMGGKDNIRRSLEKELNRAIKNQDIETADMIKDMLGKEDPRMFSKAEQKAAERAVEKWQAENQKVKDFINNSNKQVSNKVPEELEKINNEIADKYGIKTYNDVNPDKKKITTDDLDSNIDNININDVNMNDIILKAYKDLGNETKMKPEERTNYFLNNQNEYKNRLDNIAKKLSSNKKTKKQLSNEDKLKKALENYIKYKDLTNTYSDRVRNNIAQLKAGNDPNTKTDLPVAKEQLNNLMKKFDAERDIKDLAKVLDKNTFKDIINSSGISLDEINQLQTEANVNDGATALMHATDDMAIAAQKNAIVEDKTNSELNQDLFDGKELREDVRQALLKIANEFKEKLKLPMQPDDIYFTGSEANYNYNENSDIDVHLVYDFEQAGEMAEILSKYLQSAKRIFNDSHDITVKSLPVEVGAENKAEPLVTSGIYSLISNSWVKEPENANVEIEEPDQPYLDEVKMQIEDAISEKDKDKLEGIIKMVWDIRKEGLANEGEFGPGNTLFKHLRNSGLLGRLKDAYYDVESRDLSLESMLEAEFTDKNDIKVTEDDLINKSEQEIADGLMNKCSNSDEAIAKLEDVLASCNDGYKEKVKNVIQKIKESSKFGNTCRKLAEEVINKLEEYVGKNLPNMTPESYVNHLKDIADVEEILQFCYNEIHPDFKYKHPKLAATDENGNIMGVVLDGIEKGVDPKNVLYSKISMVHDPKTNAIYPKYERNNLMPIEDFKAIIHDPRNQKWYDKIMKGQTEDWDELIAEIEARARNINEKYRRWCYDNWERLDLLSYPPQYRVKLYDDIVHKGWPEANAVEKWKHTRKDRFAQKIAMPKDLQGESLDEAKSDEWYLKSQNYDIIKKELDKYVPENILNVPFAIEPKAWKNQKKQNDRNREPVHYYTVVGMEKGKNPTNFLVREVTNISDDKTWKDVNDKDHAKRHDFVMNINDIMREINYSYTDASTLKLNTPEAFEQRALEMMVGGPKSSNKVSRTGTQGHWIKLTKDEVMAVLQIMEEEQPRLWKGVTKVYLNSLNKSKGADIVMKALKAFDPSLRSSNISSIQGKPEYKLWVPKAQYDAPKKHNNNPFETLMK